MGFERCHPAVNLIFFAAVIIGMIAFQHPVFLAIGFICAWLYSLKRNRWRSALFNSILLPLIVLFAFYYSSYTHFGVTVLQHNRIGNNMTLESLVYGFVLGVAVAGVLMWFSCVHSVFTADKVVYLFGRLSPRLSLLLAITLRMVPRIKKEAKRINIAQRGIGRGAGQGNVFRRLRNCIRIFSTLITWIIDSLTTASDSMRSRGSALRRRTAFSIYRFDNRDRSYVVAIFACLTVTAMAVLLKQTEAIYDPRILINPITPASVFFYAGYGALCLLPLGLELWTGYRFWKGRRSL